MAQNEVANIEDSLKYEIKPAVISITGIEEAKKFIDAKIEANKDLIVTAETKKGVADSRKELNDYAKELKSIRQKITYDVMQQSQGVIDDLKAYEDKSAAAAKNQSTKIKEFDDIAKHEKQSKIEAYISDECAKADIEPARVFFDPKWLNTNKSIKSAKEEIDEQIKQLKADDEELEVKKQMIVQLCEAYNIDPSGWVSQIGTVDIKEVQNNIMAHVKHQKDLEEQRDRLEKQINQHEQAIDQAKNDRQENQAQNQEPVFNTQPRFEQNTQDEQQKPHKQSIHKQKVVKMNVDREKWQLFKKFAKENNIEIEVIK